MVLLRDQRSLGSYRVLNLSRGGALLVGRAPSNRSDDLDVLVRLSTGRVVRAGAVVLREESVDDASVFAIEFSRISDEDRAAIDSLVLTAVEDERDPTALVVTSGPELGQQLRRRLAGLGHRAFGVGSVADAMRLLDAPAAVSVVLIDLGLAPADVQTALEYLADKHPTIRRILVAAEADAPPPPRSLKNGARPADAVVPSPWSTEQLARALKRS